MITGKPKYNLIGTDEDPIPPDEPVFIIRAQDELGEMVVRFYAFMVRTKLRDVKLAAQVEEHADLFAVWPTRKKPD